MINQWGGEETFYCLNSALPELLGKVLSIPGQHCAPEPDPAAPAPRREGSSASLPRASAWVWVAPSSPICYSGPRRQPGSKWQRVLQLVKNKERGEQRAKGKGGRAVIKQTCWPRFGRGPIPGPLQLSKPASGTGSSCSKVSSASKVRVTNGLLKRVSRSLSLRAG